MPGEFDGKVALVTGAASGIGRAVALAFARAGAHLALADVAAGMLQETARAAEALGAAVITGGIDVTQSEDVEAFVARTVRELGGLHCAVNNAGVKSSVALLADYSEAEFDRVMAVNTRGVWLCMKHEIHAMLPAGGGAIVNIASGAGLIAVPTAGAYVTSKHAVIGLTRAGAVDYAKHGIRINAVCPGYTRTPMALASIQEMDGLTLENVAAAQPIGRIGEPEEQANAVLYLCSERSTYMVGHALVVDGGTAL
jgi:NAD(P)-dependent dehydrogenase (short-subunit alcohol dehydrogenase family)